MAINFLRKSCLLMVRLFILVSRKKDTSFIDARESIKRFYIFICYDVREIAFYVTNWNLKAFGFLLNYLTDLVDILFILQSNDFLQLFMLMQSDTHPTLSGSGFNTHPT